MASPAALMIAAIAVRRIVKDTLSTRSRRSVAPEHEPELGTWNWELDASWSTASPRAGAQNVRNLNAGERFLDH
jgi:hypothetical protein